MITREAIEKTIFIPQVEPLYIYPSEGLRKEKRAGLKVSIHMG
jgi:hypothetical protein